MSTSIPGGNVNTIFAFRPPVSSHHLCYAAAGRYCARRPSTALGNGWRCGCRPACSWAGWAGWATPSATSAAPAVVRRVTGACAHAGRCGLQSVPKTQKPITV